MSKIGFRKDINGLRCYAVLLVVLFHYGVPGFSSGFIGVDIFFVVSGFLMSAIIIPGVLNRDFKLFDFYISRIVRIVPSIIFLLVIFYAISFTFAPPESFKDYSKYAIKSLLFVSNIAYLNLQNGYFTGDSDSNFLLHTWSLSVEWQFYLVYPLMIMLTASAIRKLKSLLTLVLFILAASLLTSIHYSTIDSSFNFYTLFTRAWEMAFGGVVFILSQNKSKNAILYRIGIVLLAISAYVSYNIQLWPGYLALLPVISTALILYSANQHSIIFNNKASQLIGSASYSIYLWHWPIFVTLSYYELLTDTLSRLFYSLFSILVGIVVYALFEKKASNKLKSLKKKQILALVLIPMIISIIVFDYTRSHSGFLWRGNANYQKASTEIVLPNPDNGWCFYAIASNRKLNLGQDGLTCHIGSLNSKKKAILFGDSFAGHYIPFWDTVGKKLNLDINAITTNWCGPSTGTEFLGPKTSIAYKQCLFNREYLAKNIENYDYLIFSGAWSYIVGNSEAKQAFESLLKTAQKTGKKIIIMDEPYQFDVNIGEMYKKSVWDEHQFDISKYITNSKNERQAEVSTVLRNLSADNKNTVFLPREDLFDASQVNTQGVPYSLDGEHISVVGSLSAAEHFINTQRYTELNHFTQ
ncbi:acyltransferase family protein [Kluyvera huaxiensis]|uniref:acyltransferase family protein n=1 Tax=Kluyvera sp. 142053 TaxID=3160979 RepID=UPI0032DF1D94